MEIQTVSEDKLEIISAICLDPSVDQETRELMENGMDTRVCWIKKMMPKGLEILLALESPRNEEIHYKWVGKMFHSDLAVHGKVPMGLLEYIPIEHALEPVEGRDSLFINCMWILPPFWHKGVGSALVESIIERAKPIGGISVITYDGDSWFGTSIKYMPSSFFKKFGFEEVDRDGSRVLLFLNLGSNTQPKLIYPKSKNHKSKKTLKFEIYANNQCPWSRYMVNTFKNEISKFSDIDINVIETNRREIIKKLGLSRGVCLNGSPLIKRMASWKEIKKKFEKSGVELK
jgi:GNAT superfamily N-acetyltransferase